mgnify:CR=1 FL=1|tara:strand:- start:3234 stop:3377 length:144 start_codon:yes stop_codon:yes gene_type:complete
MFGLGTWMMIGGAALISFGASSYGETPQERFSLFCMFFGVALVAAAN